MKRGADSAANPVGSAIRGFHILVGLTLLTFVVDLLFLTVAIDMALAIPVTLPRTTLVTGLALLSISAVLAALAALPDRGPSLPRRGAVRPSAGRLP